MMPVPRELLIIAGRGTYPLLMARGARAAGVERIVVVAARGITPRCIAKLANEVVWVGVGEVERTLRWVEQTGISKAVMVGQITPMALFHTRFDAMGRELLHNISFKNAHSIFGKVAALLTERNVEVLPAWSFMDDHLPQAGTLTSRSPDEREWIDINLGFEIAIRISNLDIGQTILLKEGMVLAVEAFEGTNAAIRRGGRLGGKGAVVVKVAKKGHDMRLDIPVIGAETIPILRRARISALAVQAGRLILLDRPKAIDAANRLGIAIVAVDSGLPHANQVGHTT